MKKNDVWIPVDESSFREKGWKELDVILITGDIYVDHPSFGVAIIARILMDMGLKVLVLSRPGSAEELKKYPSPGYFVGITSGNVDSMVANYTASGKRRKNDFYAYPDSAPRPDRAVIVYCNWVKRAFKGTPVVLGGIEASLRRFAHYDWWQDKVRHSILLDSKADLLLYGMAEKALISLTKLLNRNVPFESIKHLPGTAYIANGTKETPADGLEIPSYKEVSTDKKAYARAFKAFYRSANSINGRPLIQADKNRYLVQNPPSGPLSSEEMDYIYSLPYNRELHPNLRRKISLKSYESIKSSITSHRGCYGECNFCAITIHQGRTVQSRSIKSVVEEAQIVSSSSSFSGYISDVGGPTANMYGYECEKKRHTSPCVEKRCLYPSVCKSLGVDHGQYLQLLKRVGDLPNVKGVFVSSGIRPDLIYADKTNGKNFLFQLVSSYTSGLLKLAPEHFSNKVLERMAKPSFDSFSKMYDDFYKICKSVGKEQYISAYIMVAHPGETKQDNLYLKEMMKRYFPKVAQPVQIFTPTPSTVSTTMYYTGLDPFSLEEVCSEKKMAVKKEFKRQPHIREQPYKKKPKKKRRKS